MPKIIEFHGDSTQAGATLGSGGKYVTTMVPPALQVGMMANHFKTYGNNIIRNLGYGGSTAREAISGVQLVNGVEITKRLYANGTKNFAQHIASSDANIIICNWGINDNFVLGADTDKFIRDYLELREIVVTAGKVFIAETSNPLTFPQNAERNNLIAHYAASLVSAGKLHNFEVIDIHTAITAWFPNYAGHLQDSVHPDLLMYLYNGVFLYRYLHENKHFAD
jgi:hypothetical protein